MVISQELKSITEAIAQAVQVEQIYLFGSHVYGTPNINSDYDLYIVIADDSLRPLEATRKVRRAISTVNRKTPVDVIADYRSRFEQRKQLNTLERKVSNEGVMLYERV